MGNLQTAHSRGGLTTRPMQPDEAGRLADLYNTAHAGYAGWALRSADDLRWRCAQRPGVEPGGVLVAESDAGIEGYAVVRTTGEVLEFVAPPSPDVRAIAPALLDAIEGYAREQGIERIQLNIPGDRTDLAEALAVRGFGRGQATRLYVRLNDLEKLVAANSTRIVEAMRDNRDCIALCVAKPNTMAVDRVTMQRSGWSLVLGGDSPTVTIVIEELDLVNIVAGVGRFDSAVVRRRLRVTPLRTLPMARRIMAALAIDAPWYFSHGDVV